MNRLVDFLFGLIFVLVAVNGLFRAPAVSRTWVKWYRSIKFGDYKDDEFVPIVRFMSALMLVLFLAAMISN